MVMVYVVSARLCCSYGSGALCAARNENRMIRVVANLLNGGYTSMNVVAAFRRIDAHLNSIIDNCMMRNN